MKKKLLWILLVLFLIGSGSMAEAQVVKKTTQDTPVVIEEEEEEEEEDYDDEEDDGDLGEEEDDIDVPIEDEIAVTDKEGNEHLNAPLLSASEAAIYTHERVLDGWNPEELTKNAPAPFNIVVVKGKLTWKGSDEALLYAVCKNGRVVDFTTTTSYKLPKGSRPSDIWAVRAANQMGGLGTPAMPKL
jgi:hypothetical protein